MADTLDVVALPTLKTALRINGTSNDITLARLITKASRLLDAKVGPVVVRTVTDERLDGGQRRTTTVRVKSWPVTSFTTVKEYPAGATTPVTLTEETSGTTPGSGFLAPQWFKDPALLSGELLRRSGGVDYPWEVGRQNIVATYEAGRYATTEDVDQRYVEAAILIVRNAWRAYQHGTVQVDEYDVPVETFPTFATPKAVRDLLWDEWQAPDAIPGIA